MILNVVYQKVTQLKISQNTNILNVLNVIPKWEGLKAGAVKYRWLQGP